MAKYVLVTEDLNEEQAGAVTDVLKNSLKEVGWTLHKHVEEDFDINRNLHVLYVEMAETGNPPKGASNG